jgi:thiopurine S-methyltransferase
MDEAFWHDRWKRGEIGFHQKEVNDLLVKHWPQLGLERGCRVFVPLAGKSLDMAWLAAQGHGVVANELSELAVDAFLSGQGRVPAESYVGLFVVKRAAPYEIWLGDYFALPREAMTGVAGIFDRAALIAMPRALQQLYADKLAWLAAPGTVVLLDTIDYDPSEMSGPPFSIPEDVVHALFSGPFSVELVERRDGMPRSENLKARGLTQLGESLYLLRRKTA